MKMKELKKWLEKNVDGIYISDDGLIRRKDGWRIISTDKLMAMSIEDLDDYAMLIKETIDLNNTMYEIVIRTLEYKMKKEVAE